MFSLHLLGGAALEGPSGAVSGRAAHRRRVALLALLAMARGRPVARERIIGLLWPEHPTDSARHLLSEALYVLRKDLREDVFVSAGDEVGLNARVVHCDAVAFDEAVEAGELARAARLYRGPFLDGFFVSDAPEYERWSEGERGRLARAHARAVECLAEDAEAAGRPQDAVEWWRRLAVHDPYSARTALRLMHALDAAGERAAAIWFAESHAVLLREELGVEPDPELAAFVERLRTEPARAPAPPPRRPANPAPPAEAPSVRSSSEEDRPESRREDDPDPRAVGVGAADVPAPLAPAPSADAAPSADPAPASDPKAAGEAIPIAPAVPAGVEAGTGSAMEAPPSTARRGWRWRTAVVLAAAMLAGAAAVALAVRPGRGTGGEPAAAAPGLDPRRIAVLYLDDHSAGGELEYLANGLTEMLIHELSQVEALDVISRNGVKPYRDGRMPFDSVAAALKVGSVVEGSLQRRGDSVRVTVQLIDANTQAHLESRSMVLPLHDVAGLQDALAEEVSAALRRRLGAEVRLRQARTETSSAEALTLVLRAEQARRDAAALGSRPTDALDQLSAARLLERADSLLARAEAADPRWARPSLLRGWVALSHAYLSDEGAASPHFALAFARADRVLAHDSGNARALELRGTVRFKRALASADGTDTREEMDRAERDLNAAVTAEPSLASAWSMLSQLVRVRGRHAESVQAARRALAEDAYLDGAAQVQHRLFASVLILGDLKGAGDECERGRRRFPDDYRFVECQLILLREDRSRAPDPARAWRLVEELDRIDPPARARAVGRPYSPVFRRAVAAGVLAQAGEKDSARAVLARARASVAGDVETATLLDYDEVIARMILGEREAARALLDEFLARHPTMRSYAARDPFLRELFTSPPPAPPPPAP